MQYADDWDVVSEDDECSFMPLINDLPWIDSNMGDYMQGWSERKRARILQMQLEKQEREIQELQERPQLRTRAANEALLQNAGYAHPVQAWRYHAEHYKQVRSETSDGHGYPGSPYSPRGDEPPELRHTQASLDAMISRLYRTTRSSPADDSAQDMYSVSDVHDDRGHKAPAPGTPGNRRFGRPPKATWEYLSDVGTRQLRERYNPGPEAEAPPPRPLPRSEELLRAAEAKGEARRPLWDRATQAERHSLPASPASKASGAVGICGAGGSSSSTGWPSNASRTAAGSRRSAAGPAGAAKTSDGAARGQQMHARAVRQRALQEQRANVAMELRAMEEMRECTFQPSTNLSATSAPLMVGSSSAQGYRTEHRDVAQSLYERGLQAMQRRQRRYEEGQQAQERKELSECSFQPQINGHEPLPPTAAVHVGQQASTPVAESIDSARRKVDPGVPLEFPDRADIGLTASGPVPEASPATGAVAAVSVQQSVMAMLDQWRGGGQKSAAVACEASVAAMPSPARAARQQQQAAAASPIITSAAAASPTALAASPDLVGSPSPTKSAARGARGDARHAREAEVYAMLGQWKASA
eukprot:TRINITY_DN31521_c0_g2_i4.p1 TRINITY_DN31521_c0_g2~~TRINITY_DN31521_c0_g2_i4.p1  ORF type:complete len:586 (+),score=123.11 TRINITY_DN31521_c0_g2_i4:127-1884(+)